MTLPIGSEPVEPERWQEPLFPKLVGVFMVSVLLLSFLFVRLGGRQKEAAITATQADIHAYAQALDLYELDNGAPPSTEQGLNALYSKPSAPPEPLHWKQYTQKPIKPDPWGHAYVYRLPGVHNPIKYDLYSVGPDGVEGTEDDITNWK